MGYHTVILPTAAPVTPGKKFSVLVKFTSPGFNWPVPIEYARAGYSSHATAAAGQSFVSGDGNTWYDFTHYASQWPKTNVCIKAFGKAP
jgi:hypothetical protein